MPSFLEPFTLGTKRELHYHVNNAQNHSNLRKPASQNLVKRCQVQAFWLIMILLQVKSLHEGSPTVMASREATFLMWQPLHFP